MKINAICTLTNKQSKAVCKYFKGLGKNRSKLFRITVSDGFAYITDSIGCVQIPWADISVTAEGMDYLAKVDRFVITQEMLEFMAGSKNLSTVFYDENGAVYAMNDYNERITCKRENLGEDKVLTNLSNFFFKIVNDLVDISSAKINLDFEKLTKHVELMAAFDDVKTPYVRFELHKNDDCPVVFSITDQHAMPCRCILMPLHNTH